MDLYKPLFLLWMSFFWYRRCLPFLATSANDLAMVEEAVADKKPMRNAKDAMEPVL